MPVYGWRNETRSHAETVVSLVDRSPMFDDLLDDVVTQIVGRFR